MIKAKMKYCEECGKLRSHTYQGKNCRSLLLWWFDIAWKCDKCGCIHIQDTAYPECDSN